MKSCLRKDSGSCSLIGLIITAAFISFLWLVYLNSSLRTTLSKDKEIDVLIQKDGIDTSGPASILQSTKQRIKGIEQMQMQSEQRLFNDVAQEQY
jgi:hypothetical protein